MLKIAIVPNGNKDSGLSVTGRLLECLHGRAEIHMPVEYKGIFEDALYDEDVYEAAELVIVIGGDGTIINSAVPCAKRSIPVLGVNLGRIGFMSEVEICDIENAVNSLLEGDYIIEERMMMSTRVARKSGEQLDFIALNDTVLEKESGVKLIGMELFSGGEKISQYVADGLIISTPTGSTGYNLSAGGPVVNPLMSLFIATAICPHMLTARPAILPSDKPIVLKPGCDVAADARVLVDGNKVCEIGLGDEVIITRSEYAVKLIKTVRRSFYDTLIEKLK